MGNLVSPSADEPDNRRAPTSTAELPTERDNDAAPALGARPNQEREPAPRHKNNKLLVGMSYDLLTKVNVDPGVYRGPAGQSRGHALGLLISIY